MSASIKVAKQGQMMMPGVMPGAGSQRAVPMGNGYVGDPGLFGTLWGGIKGAVGGLLTGGPIGAIGGAISGALGEKEAVMTATPRLPPMRGTGATIGFFPTPPQQNGGSSVTIGGMGPGGPKPFLRYGPTQENGGQGGEWMAGKASSAGYHWNKSGYFLKDGTWIAKGTRQVKNRRRNPLNPRALDRSISRITSAKRASKKLSRVTIRKAASCR